MKYDLFICHASEDKQEVALPLANYLKEEGLNVWLDQFELTLGDDLRRKIDHGLSNSQYGVVILSPSFFSKEWPNKELDGLVSREDGNNKVILPVWHQTNSREIRQYSPLLAGKYSVPTSQGIEYVGGEILKVVRQGASTESQPDNQAQTSLNREELFTTLVELPRSQFNKLVFSLDVPSEVLPSSTVEPGDRVFALLQWAKGTTGCGLSKLEAKLKSLFPQ